MFPLQQPEPCLQVLRLAKRTEVVALLCSTSSASGSKTPRSIFATIEAENQFPSHHHAQKCIRAGQMLFAYFALFANPVKTIFIPLNSKFSFGSC
jgi:hypothetical protein